MRKVILFCNFLVTSVGAELIAQDYNEEAIRQQLDKYIENPKLYYEKIKSLNDKAEKANENTLKVSEEYLALMDKKDSLIKIYKNQAIKAKSAVPVAPSNPATAAASPAGTSKTVVATPPKQDMPYGVQLAAFFREDFSRFFGTFNKTIGVEKLDNRNVIEVQGFKDSVEAYEFSQKIKKLGFPGAFVTKYNNGARQEGYSFLRTSGLSNPNISTNVGGGSSKRNLEYPEWIPLGYQEILGKKETPTISSKATDTKVENINKPLTPAKPATPPTYPTIGSMPKTTAAGTPSAPKALATSSLPQTPTSSPKPAQTSTKVNAAESRDQLDAAFDQLFKR